LKYKIKFIMMCLAAFCCLAGLRAQTSILTFDGVNDCVAIGDMGAEITTQYTAEAWIKPASLGDGLAEYGRTIFASSTDTSKPLWLTQRGSELRVYTFVGQSNAPYHDTSGAGITVDQWHHIAVSSVKGGTTVLYVDGVPVLNVASGTEGLWNTIFTIGDLRPGRELAFHGEIADVRVWNTIRTQTEIQSNMYGGVPGDSAGLVGYWKLDGDALDSSSGTSYDGVIQNGTAIHPAPDWNGLDLWIEETDTYVGYEEEFTLYAKIRNVPWINPLRGFEISFLSDYAGSASGTQFYTSGEEGAYTVSNAILSVPPGTWDYPFGASGDGTLFSMTLKTLTSANCTPGVEVSLSDVILRNEINQPIVPTSVEPAFVHIEGTQTIPLYTGWNLISAWLVPAGLDMENEIFAQLIADGYLVKVQDEAGTTLVQDIYGDWENYIGDWQTVEGYYVQVNDNCFLELTGCPLPLPMTIDLHDGWNIIPYPYQYPQDTMTFLDPLLDVLEKVQDESGNTIVQGLIGNWIIDEELVTLKTDEGYYVYVTEDTTFTYPAPARQADKSFLNIKYMINN